MSDPILLSQLGWSAFFQQQLSLEQWQETVIGRITAQHRSHFDVATERLGYLSLDVTPATAELTVGDWILLDHQGKFEQALERLSLFSRKAAGTRVATQLIGANIDTVFVVCSLNRDFNLSRIERYLALVNDADVEPVIVLTKADCCESSPQDYVRQVQSLDPMLMVEAVNGLDHASVSVLLPWCREGKTVAFLGSSGVGKSTLINTLLADVSQTTGAIREDDSKGRHTTTGRSLHLMPSGGMLLDTPGMRELQLSDCQQGVAETFADITELAELCQFSDCQHQREPGCAVQAAIEAGELEPRRLVNYGKLMREQAHNGATLAEKRAKDRDLGRYIRVVHAESRQRKKFR